MKAYQVTYLRKNGSRTKVLVLRDADTITTGQLIDEQVAASDSLFAQVVHIERLTESVVYAL